MRISPEPLSPMRNWRELWQAEPLPYERILREQAALPVSPWKNNKRTSFQWLSHLLNRGEAR